MISRLLMMSFAISIIVLVSSAGLNCVLYGYLIQLDGIEINPIAEAANLPGIPIYAVFADHLANRNDAAKMRQNALILLVSGTVGWSVAAFFVVFVLGAIFFEPRRQRTT